MFPDGWPGAGLILLRVAVGTTLLLQGAACFDDRHELEFLTLAVVALTSAVGLLLLIGFLTRFAAVMAALLGVSSILSWFPGSNAGPLVNPTTAALSAAIAAALTCLGPGAFALDARLFGRREIIIPARSSQP